MVVLTELFIPYLQFTRFEETKPGKRERENAERRVSYVFRKLRRSLNGWILCQVIQTRWPQGCACDRGLLVWLVTSGFPAADFGHKASGSKFIDHDVNTLISCCQSETGMWLISSPN